MCGKGVLTLLPVLVCPSEGAILLEKGQKVVFTPLYLGSLFAQLDECLNVIRSMGRYDVVTHVDSAFCICLFGTASQWCF